MNVPDAINCAFEMAAGATQTLNCRRLVRDRIVKGVDWRATAFFALWGFWNLFYYPHLTQWLSFIGGVMVTTANVTWVVLALRYGAHNDPK